MGPNAERSRPRRLDASGSQTGRHRNVSTGAIRARPCWSMYGDERRQMTELSRFDRVYGCLLGGAVGDALGAPVEFLSHKKILARYGAEGITQFDAAYGRIGRVTDDTQMALFTVEGLIRAWVRFADRGICDLPGVVHRAYLRWLITQDRSYEELSEIEAIERVIDGWLIRDARLWASRAPGNTCLSALRATWKSRQFSDKAANDSKGCGTVMRDAAFGLARIGNPVVAFKWAVETAWTTHGHPSARYSSGALAVIIAHIAQGDGLLDAVTRALAMLPRGAKAGEVRDALRRAVDLSRAPDWRRRLPELGAGWVAEEALAISVLCALAAKDAREAIVAAVNHDGRFGLYRCHHREHRWHDGRRTVPARGLDGASGTA